MRKKIDVRDVRLGMYIAELDRPWLETPFMFQGFTIESQAALDKLRELCRYVWIEIPEEDKFKPKYLSRDALARMRVLEEEDERLRRKVREIAERSTPVNKRKPYQDATTFEEELVQAKEIETEARNLMRDSVQEVMRGKPLDLKLADKVVGRMVDSIIRNPDALVCLGQLKEVSEYTALHSVRCCTIALALGRHLALNRDELRILGLGALLHDIGMAKVPEAILNKQGGLNENEFHTMTRHVGWGLGIARESGGVPPGAEEVIAQHHERGDGSGYPGHRRGAGITPAGMIGAIVDVYDAVTSDRMYKVALSAEDALKRIYEWRHKDFSAQMVEEFIRCMGIFPIGSLVELSTGSVGVVITINRARRLKPKVALVLTASKSPYSARIICDLMEHTDAAGQEIKISRVLPTGAYGINPMDYIVQL
jgi:HD-GYP domain-containing protein (c-di-GMP phosphodiesterase class II)